ncbi:MAG: cytochrome c oxidase subunit 3 [Saprospiraceae bacterium]|nr:cytochrome c oxidase subunit 3 [Saprospiraceae bacterium]
MEAVQTYNRRNRINAQKFALWAAMASIMMMFGAFTSAYIVKQASGNWLEFSLPQAFYFSTGVILISSVLLHYSYVSFKSGMERRYRQFLVMSFVAGVLFLILQYLGWTDLFDRGVDMKGNVSGSFLYLITGVHALHVIGGLAALTVAMIHAFALKFTVTQKRINRFELVLHYWHFVDVLWIYLFLFLMFKK